MQRTIHRRPRRRRQFAATLTAALALLAAPTAAGAAVTDEPGLVGLHGVQDATYDGAFRQSLVLIAQTAAGESPDPAAIAWLLSQQCPDGGFMGLRVDKACTPDPDLFTAEDSNATALAAIALAAVGEGAAADAALDFLSTVQDGGGGFEFQAGFGADPNSTGLGIMALIANGADPTAFNGGDAVAALTSMQADCTADPLDIGGYIAPFLEPPQADLLATVQALPAAAGASLPVAPPATFDDTVTDISCPGVFADPATAAADWLEQQPLSSFAAVDQRAFAILGFAAVGAGETKARELFAAMTADLPTALYDTDGDLRPGAAALYVLAAIALGEDPTFGDADLLTALADSRLTAALEPTPTPTTTATPVPADPDVAAESTGAGELADSGAGTAGYAVFGLGLSIAGIALLTLSRRFGLR